MSMDYLDQPSNQEDEDFVRPKDGKFVHFLSFHNSLLEFGFYYKAFKLEEKKMITH